MFNFFHKIKSTGLIVTSIILNITILLYLTSLFGFDHINKELVINAFTGISIALIILLLAISSIGFILYASFKVAYKKVATNIDNLTKIVNELEKR